MDSAVAAQTSARAPNHEYGRACFILIGLHLFAETREGGITRYTTFRGGPAEQVLGFAVSGGM